MEENIAMITLSQKNGDSINIEINLNSVINTNLLNGGNIEILRNDPTNGYTMNGITTVKELYEPLIEHLLPSSTNTSTTSSSTTSTTNSNTNNPHHPQPIYNPRPMMPTPIGFIPPVGGNDVFPNFGNPPGGLGPLSGGRGDGGIVGPDHPLFGGIPGTGNFYLI